MPMSRLDLRLHQIAEYAGDHQHQTQRQPDPGGLLQQEHHRQHGRGDAEHQRAAQPSQDFLGLIAGAIGCLLSSTPAV